MVLWKIQSLSLPLLRAAGLGVALSVSARESVTRAEIGFVRFGFLVKRALPARRARHGRRGPARPKEYDFKRIAGDGEAVEIRGGLETA